MNATYMDWKALRSQASPGRSLMPDENWPAGTDKATRRTFLNCRKGTWSLEQEGRNIVVDAALGSRWDLTCGRKREKSRELEKVLQTGRSCELLFEPTLTS